MVLFILQDLICYGRNNSVFVARAAADGETTGSVVSNSITAQCVVDMESEDEDWGESEGEEMQDLDATLEGGVDATGSGAGGWWCALL